MKHDQQHNLKDQINQIPERTRHAPLSQLSWLILISKFIGVTATTSVCNSRYTASNSGVQACARPVE